MAIWDYSDFSNDALYPFEVDLEQAARLLHASLLLPEQATQADIFSALIKAVEAGELKPKRGTLKYDWATPEPILDARDLLPWAKAAYLELDLSDYGACAWQSYCATEAKICAALDARLKALRATDGSYLAETIPLDLTQAQLRDRLTACLGEKISLLDEKASLASALMEPAIEPELDPRHRKTMLRIIGALLEMAKLGESISAKSAAMTIIQQFELLGQKPLDWKTIHAVITSARQASNEAIE